MKDPEAATSEEDTAAEDCDKAGDGIMTAAAVAAVRNNDGTAIVDHGTLLYAFSQMTSILPLLYFTSSVLFLFRFISGKNT